MNHMDLCSGIGGFALAARWAGIETIVFCEKDAFCQQVLKKHWPDVPCYPDIKDFNLLDGRLDGRQVDLLTAGFPCQPFSVAGKRKGIADDRYLWPECFRIIQECRPRHIILENVPGIIPHLDLIFEDLEREGYAWRAYLIPASAVAAPHKRERLWVVAHANGIRCNNGVDNREGRPIQDDWQRHVTEIQQEWHQWQPWSWTTFNAQDWLGFACHTNCISSQQADSGTFTKQEEWNPRIRHSRQHWETQPIFNWEKDKPPIPGVDDGLSKRLDGVARNKALGNAIVPQIAYLLMRLILISDSV